MAKAEKGDLIRVVTEDNRHVKLGDICEVYSSTDKGGVVIDAPKPKGYSASTYLIFIYDYEYEIFRKAGEEAADAVNHPNHYTQGRFETIEIIEEITQGYSDGYVAYCVGNALKYLARAPFKHGEPTEDLLKAAKYLAFANEYLDAKSTETTE